MGSSFEAAQYQDIKHENDVNYTTNPTTPKLYDLKSGLQVPMANLYMDVQLADGIRLNVTLYVFKTPQRILCKRWILTN